MSRERKPEGLCCLCGENVDKKSLFICRYSGKNNSIHMKCLIKECQERKMQPIHIIEECEEYILTRMYRKSQTNILNNLSQIVDCIYNGVHDGLTSYKNQELKN